MSTKRVDIFLFFAGMSPRQTLMLRSLKVKGWQVSVIAWDRNGNSRIPAEYNDVVDRWRWIHLPAPTWSLRLMPYRKMLAHLSHALIGMALHQQARIYPFVSAGNGKKFFTYMQAGLAVIGPDFYEVGKAVKMADCGVLVDTESPQAVADAVSRLLDNPDELKRLRRNARAAFEQRFNWEKEQPKFVRFIEEVMR